MLRAEIEITETGETVYEEGWEISEIVAHVQAKIGAYAGLIVRNVAVLSLVLLSHTYEIPLQDPIKPSIPTCVGAHCVVEVSK